jgi:ribosomal-protein-alanine N-acetyltransferase
MESAVTGLASRKIAIMPTPATTATIRGVNVYLRPPRTADAATFLAAARRSRALHGRWTQAPVTAQRFALLVKRYAQTKEPATQAGFLVFRRDDDALVGVFNFSEIVRGAFQSTYLGYYAFRPLSGQGLMTEALALALDVAFRKLALHRVEVNVQPANVRSIGLVERLGFAREGYSRRYVKIAGRWRDHIRFAMLAEDWRTLRRQYRFPRREKAS